MNHWIEKTLKLVSSQNSSMCGPHCWSMLLTFRGSKSWPGPSKWKSMLWGRYIASISAPMASLSTHAPHALLMLHCAFSRADNGNRWLTSMSWEILFALFITSVGCFRPALTDDTKILALSAYPLWTSTCLCCLPPIFQSFSFYILTRRSGHGLQPLDLFSFHTTPWGWRELPDWWVLKKMSTLLPWFSLKSALLHRTYILGYSSTLWIL